MRRTRPIALASSETPQASIVILALKRYDRLARCLHSIATKVGDEVPYEVLVVLNGSEADVRPWLESHVSGVRIIASAVNRGFGGGNNFGAAFARGRYLVLLNDDTEVKRGWLESLVRTADARPDAGAVGSRLLFRTAASRRPGK